jgi:pimeloyl-ACP methyl ester carboxylesterase
MSRAGKAKTVMIRRTEDERGALGVAGAALTGLVSAGAGLGLGWLAVSRWAIDHDMTLPLAIDADRRAFDSPRAGRLSYYHDRRGEGTPLVLLHSINAGASAFEVSPLFEALRGQRPVYAPDLPGFGFSDRSDREYTPELYAAAIEDMLESVVGDAADVVAMSLTSEFAARVALRRPDLVRSLALLSPSGFNRRDQNATQRSNSSGTSDRVRRVLLWPGWSQALYDLLVTRPSLRYFLRQSFVGEPPEELIDYAYLTTHQPGARFAPFAFVSGRLFTRDIRETVYERLDRPALVIYDDDAFVSFETLPDVLARHDNWRAERVAPTMGLPHWERPRETVAALERFWAGQPA